MINLITAIKELLLGKVATGESATPKGLHKTIISKEYEKNFPVNSLSILQANSIEYV